MRYFRQPQWFIPQNLCQNSKRLRSGSESVKLSRLAALTGLLAAQGRCRMRLDASRAFLEILGKPQATTVTVGIIR
jgi:hypothetical protein